MKKNLSNNYLKISQAAKALGVSPDTLRRWEKEGRITPQKTLGGTRLYPGFLKIGAAAKTLGVSIDTLRRWEKRGKIKSIRTAGGTRLYPPDMLVKEQKISPTEDLLKELDAGQLSVFKEDLPAGRQGQDVMETGVKTVQIQQSQEKIYARIYAYIPLLVTTLIITAVAGAVMFVGFKEPPAKSNLIKNVLGALTSQSFLEINSDTQINGALAVRDTVNNLKLEATPSASTMEFASGDTILTITDSSTIDQNLSTASSPSFDTLNLSASKNQLTVGSGTLTWTPTATRTITLPDLTGEVSLLGQTISNSELVNSKVTVSAGTNLTGGGDVALGSSITLSITGSPSFSGVVSLADGSASAPSLTFSNDADTGLYRIDGNRIGLITGGSATSGITINGNGNVGIGTITPSTALHVVGAGTVTGNLTVDTSTLVVDASVDRVGIGASVTPSSKLGVVGNVGIGKSFGFAAAPRDGLAVEGNVGIGTSSPDFALHVIGNVGVGTSLTVSSAASLNTLNVSGISSLTGNVGIGASLTVSSLATFLSPLHGADGSATAPGLSFNLDPDTGIFRPSANALGFATNGSSKLSLTEAGSLGLGITSPSQIFQVNSGGSSTVITSGGNVGVGTTSPATALHIIGATTFAGNLLAGINNTYDIGTSAITFRNIYANQVTATTLVGTNDNANFTSSIVTINSDNDTDDTQDASLRFHRGTASPHALLTWDSTNKEFDLNSQLHITGTITGTNGIMLDGVTNDIITPGNETLALIPGGTGNVGINTTSPYAKLQVRGAGTGTGLTFLTTDSTGAQRLAVLDNGNVGIGTTAPNGALSIQGSVGIGYTGASQVLPSNGLAVFGNVGIGITTANSALSVAGGAHIGSLRQGITAPTNGLFVDGNVGIGATTAAYNLDVWGTGRITGALTVGGNLGIGTSLTVDSAAALTSLNVSGISSLTGNVGIGASLTANSLSTFLSSILGADGSATAPGYAFNLDTDTGIFRPGTNALGLSTAGASRLTVTAAGLVGIGMTSPAATFQVNSGASSTVINSSGNIGIGTTSPRMPLEVVGNNIFSALFTNGNVGIGTTAPVGALSVSGNVGVGGSSAGAAYNFETWGTGRITGALTVGGNLGIGTSLTVDSAAALTSLNVSGISSLTGNVGIGASALINGLTTSLGGLRVNGFADLTGNVGIGASAVVNGNIYTPLGLRVGGFADLAGNVGIGSSALINGLTTSLGGLRVNGFADLTGNVGVGGSLTANSLSTFLSSILGSDGSVSAPGYAFNLDTDTGIFRPGTNALGLSTAGASRLTVTAAGLVGIGITSPAATFQVNSGASSTVINSSGNVGIGTTTANSALSVAGGAHIGSLRQGIAAPTNGLFVDGNVGIGATSSSNALDIWGDALITGTLTVGTVGNISSTGVFLASDGSASAPSYSFNGDTDTGLFHSTNLLRLTAGGAEAIRIDQANLDFYQTAPNNGTYYVQFTPASLTGVTGQKQFTLYNGASLTITSGYDSQIYHQFNQPSITAATPLTVTTAVTFQIAGAPTVSSSGIITNTYGLQVGRATTIAGAAGTTYGAIDIPAHTVTTNTTTQITSSPAAAGLRIGQITLAQSGGAVTVDNAASLYIANAPAAGASVTLTNPYALWVDAGQVRLDGNLEVQGNTGIGTSVPNAKLSIQGNVGIGYTGVNQVIPTNGLAVFGNVGIGTTTANSALSVAGGSHIGSLRQGIAAPTNGLFVDGNVGIGATTSTNALDVWGNSRITGTLTIDSTVTALNGLVGYSGVTAPTSGLAVSGNVGIGTTSPIAPLHIWGNGTNSGLFLNGNIGVGWTSPVQAFQINPTNVGLGLTVSNTFVVTSQGNVGIGNSAPRSALDIYNGSVLQTPTNPTYVGGVDGSAGAGGNDLRGLAITGRYAYVTKTNNTGTCSTSDRTGCELQVYDITIPSSPTFVGGADTGGTANTNNMYVPAGKYAYIAKSNDTNACNSTTNTGCEFQIYDISNPTSPIFMGGASNGGGGINFNGVFIAGRYAYVTGSGAAGTGCSSSDSSGCELQIFDISNPTNPTFVGGADNGGNNVSRGVVVSGRYAYVIKLSNINTCDSTTNTGCELQIYDVSSPASPLYVGGVDTGDNGALGIYISGRYAYVSVVVNTGACNSSTKTGCELQIYDISNPTSPSFVGGGDSGQTTADSGNTLARGVFVAGRYAYFVNSANSGTCNSSTATGCELQVWDVSTPSSPSFVGGVDDGGVTGYNIYVSGRYAYLNKLNDTNTCSSTTNTGCELQVYDISGVETTSLMAHSLEAGSLQVRENGIVNNQLYVGGGLGVGVGGILSQGPVGIGVTSAGPALYVQQLGTGIAATFIGGNIGIGTSTTSSTLQVIGNSVIGFAPSASGPASGLAVSGNVGIGTTTANSALEVAGLITVNDGSASLPAFSFRADTDTGIFRPGTNALGLATAGSSRLTVTAGGNVGIGITSPAAALQINGLGFAAPSSPTYIAGLENGAAAAGDTEYGVFVQGRYLYNVKGNNIGACSSSDRTGCEFQIYDFTNPLSPTYLGGADLGGNATDVFVSGRYAYVMRANVAGACTSTTSTGCEILIYDISDPTTPTFVGGIALSGSLTNSGNGGGIYISGRYAYLALTDSGQVGTCAGSSNTGCTFQIWDISDSTSPSYVGGETIKGTGIGTSNDAGALKVQGRYAYINKKNNKTGTCDATDRTGCELMIFDVFNPAAPVYKGGIDDGGFDPFNIAVSGRYAYMNTYSDVRVYDVSNPASPTLAATISISQNYGLTVAGRYLYVAQNSSNLLVYDVGNPASPVQVSSTTIGGSSYLGLAVAGRFAIVSIFGNTGTCSSTTATGCEIQIYDLGGFEGGSVVANALEAGSVQIRENASIVNNLTIGGGINLGSGGLLSQGTVGIGVSSGVTALRVEQFGFAGVGSTAPTAIFNGGNVGIGATNSSLFPNLSSMLWVGGNVGIGWTGTGTGTPAVPRLGLSVFGNVGAGTTSPAGALHVVGQCVTGDTKLRRRKRNKKGELTDEYEDVEIKDIKEGDEILTLDEKTGKLISSKVNALLDKGFQDTYILRTQSGKKIRTTIEHPYLVREASTISGTFEADQSIRIEQLAKTSYIALADKQNRKLILSIDPEFKQRLVKFYRKANRQNLFGPSLWARSVLALINKMEIANSVVLLDEEYTKYHSIISRIIEQERPDITVGFRSIGKNSPAHKAAYFAHKKMTGAQNQIKLEAEDVLHFEFTKIRTPSGQLTKVYNKSFDLSRGKWKKVSDIKPGMEVLTTDGWERITALGKVGREQVYDIEVEGTHNFVGNDIVAHNTYLQGSAGIGAAFAGLTTPTNGLALSGNLGIGTTTANSTLSVAGSAHIGTIRQGIAAPSNGLFVDGNVGIGATTSNNPLDVWGNSRITGTLNLDGNSLIGFGGASLTGPTNGLAVSGNVGIGITTANSTLSVAGSAHIGSLRQGFAAPTDGLFVDGNVGIGATTSTNALDVWGNAAITGSLTIGSAGNITSTGQFLGKSGNQVAAPSYSFQGDTSTGIYSASAGNIQFSSSGVLRYTFSPNTLTFERPGVSGGATGINLPAATNTAVTAEKNTLLIGGDTQTITGGYTNQRFNLFNVPGVSAASALTVTNADTIHILGAPNTQSSALITNSSALRIGGASGVGPGVTNSYGLYVDAQTGATNNYAATFMGGNVGIGTSTPTATLSIAGNVGIGFTNVIIPSSGFAVSGNMGIGTTTTASSLQVVGNGVIGFAPSAAGPASGLAVSGNVGIGTTSPRMPFEIWGNGTYAATFLNGNVGIGTTIVNGSLIVGSGGPSGTGNVGIGLTGFAYPSFKLQVAGNIGPDAGPTIASTTQIATSVDTTGSVGTISSVAIAPDGFPVISYIRAGVSARVTKCGNADCSSGNTTTTIVSGNIQAGFTHMAIGTDGLPFFIYMVDTAGDGIHAVHCGNATCSSGNIDTAVATAAVGGMYNFAMAIGTDGFPVIVFRNPSTGQDNFVKCNNATCSSSSIATNVTSDTTARSGFSLVIGTDGLPIFSFRDGNAAIIRVTHCGNASCSASNTTTTIESTLTDNGNTTGIAIGSDGLPIVTFQDSGNGDLVVVHCGNILCSAGNQRTSVDTANTVGDYGSIAIGTDGFAIISYYDGTVANQDLRVFHCTNIVCSAGTATSIDTTGNVGQWTSIAIGTDGLPFISFYDVTNADLRVIKCATVSCSATTGTALSGGYQLGGWMPNPHSYSAAMQSVNTYRITNPSTFQRFSILTGGSEQLSITPAGNVGVGISAPYGLLNLSRATFGTPGTTGQYFNISPSTFTDSYTAASGTAANMVFNSIGQPTLTSANSPVTTTNAYSFYLAGAPVAGTNELVNNSIALGIAAGAVGTGTTASYGLYVNAQTGAASNYAANFATGNVGIGFTSPARALDVSSTIVRFRENTSAPTLAYDGDFAIGNVGAGDSASGRMWIRSGGITYRFQSTTNAADYSEFFYQGDQNIQPGDVIMADNSGSPILGTGKVTRSGQPYQGQLLGVVTEYQRGTGYNNPNDDRQFDPNFANVGLLGHVYTKVSTENGPIEVGDYLTSSSLPGIAMKATKPGPVVGKALESFDGQEIGKILAFINVSYADPGNFFASLSFDDSGSLIVPKIKAGSILLDPSLATASAKLTIDNGQLAINEDPNYSSTSPTLPNNNRFDLTEKIDSLDKKIKDLESTVSAKLAEATSSAEVKLTPPDILLATGSATLANLKVTSEATVSGRLLAYDLNISNSLKSLGETTVGNTIVAGHITVDGTLSIENGSEINVLGTLYLQKTLLAESLDIFNGKVTIDKKGNIATQGKITASEIQTSKLTISNPPIASSSGALAASIGTAAISANTTKITVETGLVTNSSKIFITPITATDKVLYVTNVKAGESFDVSASGPASPDEIKFNWWIVQTN